MEGQCVLMGLQVNQRAWAMAASYTPAMDSASIENDNQGSLVSRQDKGLQEKPLQQVAPPGHGSGCGHCTAQAVWVPPEQADTEFRKMKQNIYNEVYRHEQAHAAGGGRLAGGITVTQNADGSASGHVPVSIPGIDTTNPDNTLSDARLVVAGAMAPSDPSSQDYAVAAQGRALESKAHAAKAELTKDKENPEMALFSKKKPAVFNA